MRGTIAPAIATPGGHGGSPLATLTIETITRSLLEEFPELDPGRVRKAVERATAKAASTALDTAGSLVVDQQLSRVEASEDARERAQILRDLAESLEAERGDADRALVVRLAAFTEAPLASEIETIIRLAHTTKRLDEVPLDVMVGTVDPTSEASTSQLVAIADAWQQRGDTYRAADTYERVLVGAPANLHAHEALELFYRSTREWPVLIDLLGRRAVHTGDHERAELFREMAVIYDRELGDDAGALDAYREAERLEPNRPDVLDALARLITRVNSNDDPEALDILERLARLVGDPKPRAEVLYRAADIARHHDYDRAHKLYERSRTDDPDFAPAIDGLATLLRDRGMIDRIAPMLVDAAARPALISERSRWLADAADYLVAQGDTDRAKELYREARDADPTNHKAGVALVELCWDTGSLVELVPILDDLVRTTSDPARLHDYLVQRSKVAQQLGDSTTTRQTLSRAIEIDPGDAAARRELADLMFDNQEWARARELFDIILDDPELQLATADQALLHYRLARCAREIGDTDEAAKQTGITLALDPDHRPALLLRAELDAADPDALLADQLALANTAPPDEKGARFAALGDRYVELGDRATAREMYREALQHRKTDHLLLTKFLELVADDGDWSYSLDLVQRLIDTEEDAKIRARYRNLAAQIARDELDRADDAMAMFTAAVEDDPLLFAAADQVEAMLVAAGDRDSLAAFYYKRLGHVRTDEGRPGERLRLWDKLGELCLALGRGEDAVVAFEVALTLAPDDAARRLRLADLYVTADPKHDPDAIALHHTVLRKDRRRLASYEALRTLYARTGDRDKSRACDEVVAILSGAKPENLIHELFGTGLASQAEGATRVLSNDDWLALSRLDVDLQLSGLFALVAPAFAAERARTRPPLAMPQLPQDIAPATAKVIAKVITAFGVPRPAIFLDKDQAATCTASMRHKDGVLLPIVVLGKPAADALIDDHELAFCLARTLADLRTERVARLLCPKASELAEIIELAASAQSTGHSGRWLTTSLHAVELDRALAIGTRLRDRQVEAMPAALKWLAATGRAADRIGFVVAGDLARCVAILERESDAADRITDLVWASVTEQVLGVRARVEGWGGPRPAPAP